MVMIIPSSYGYGLCMQYLSTKIAADGVFRSHRYPSENFAWPLVLIPYNKLRSQCPYCFAHNYPGSPMATLIICTACSRNFVCLAIPMGCWDSVVEYLHGSSMYANSTYQDLTNGLQNRFLRAV